MPGRKSNDSRLPVSDHYWKRGALAEWERKTRKKPQQREKKVRQHVLQQTGAIFTGIWKQAVRDGLLEKLEKEKAVDADTVTDTDEVEELEEIADVNDETEKLLRKFLKKSQNQNLLIRISLTLKR